MHIYSQVSLSRVGSASVLGLRKQNEDRLRIARIHDNLLYFAVFDGHGGPHAADYCYTFMEKFIRFKQTRAVFQMRFHLIKSFYTDTEYWIFLHRDALEDEDDLEKVLKKAFLNADVALQTHLSYFNNGEIESNNIEVVYVVEVAVCFMITQSRRLWIDIKNKLFFEFLFSYFLKFDWV